jgi:hypothetical protein
MKGKPVPCPVQRVFAMWDRDTGNGIPLGTTNPFYTALDLAQSVTPKQPTYKPVCPSPPQDPLPPLTGYVPEMCFQDAGYDLVPRPPNVYKYYLCEYPVDNVGPKGDPNNNCEANAGIKQDGSTSHLNALYTYPKIGKTQPPLYSYLLNYFQTTPASSVAIFYTSQGMPGVSYVLGANPILAFCGSGNCIQNFTGTADCPSPLSAQIINTERCYQGFDPNLSWPSTARSSANIFYFQSNQFAKQYVLDPTKGGDYNLTHNLQFFQCYNLNHYTQLIVPGSYFCQYSGNIANGLDNANSLTSTTVGQPLDKTKPPANISDIRGKICIAGTITLFQPDRDTFGTCTGPSTSAPELAASPHDLDANMVSDIVWRDTNGDIALWLMNGSGVASSGGLGNVPATWSLVGQRDFDGNGTADLLWRDTSGNTSIWFMNGTAIASTAGVGNIPTNWTVIATGDFNGDGMGDILWQDASGNLSMWLMNGATVLGSGSVGNVPANWSLAGTGDFDGDGKTDLFWRDNLGNNAIWFMNGTTIASTGGLGNIPTTWTVVGIGDFDGDGKSDVVWRDGSGSTSIWLMNGASVSSAVGLGTIPVTFSIAQTGDFNGDGKSDLLWRDTSGNTAVWFMNGASVASTASLGNVPTNWTVQSVNAD